MGKINNNNTLLISFFPFSFPNPPFPIDNNTNNKYIHILFFLNNNPLFFIS